MQIVRILRWDERDCAHEETRHGLWFRLFEACDRSVRDREIQIRALVPKRSRRSTPRTSMKTSHKR